MSKFPAICPVCDSKNIELKTELREVSVPMAEPTFQNINLCHCNDCLSDILIDADAPKKVQLRILEKAKESMSNLIKKINENGYNDSRVERAFTLAPHTINRWKQGKQVSAAAIALSRCIALLPELVESAETGFDEVSTRRLIIQKTFERYINPCSITALCGLSIDRKKDAGFYIIKAAAEGGETISPEITLEVRSDGASFIQLPLVAHIKLSGPCDIVFSIFKKGEPTPLFELGRVSIADGT